MQQYFKIQSVRDAVRVALAMVLASVCATPAFAVGSITDLTSVTEIICTITNVVSGPYLFGIGVVVIIVAAVGVASSESTIMKLISGALVGLGIAAAALPLVKNHLGVAAAC